MAHLAKIVGLNFCSCSMVQLANIVCFY